ncbi:hypothetical protein M0R45_026763 [Rubus argutus]|uniref:Uncharacterized protein n=1 Tax=Rubus argutus TaxID=59490 RepID=A0AAW1X085_RUBAR
MKWKTRTTGSERVPGLVIGKRGFVVRVYPIKPIKKLPNLDHHPLATSSSIKDRKGFKLLESPSSSSSESGRIEINKKRERLTDPSDPKPNNKRFKSSSESEVATQNPSQPKKTTSKITRSVSKGGLDQETLQPKPSINQEGLSKQNQGGKSESNNVIAPPPSGAPTPLRKLVLAARNKLDELNAQRRNEQGEGETRKREEEANIIMKKNHLEEAENKRSTWILDRQEFKLKVQEVENKAYKSPLFQDNLQLMKEFQKLISQSS